MRLFIVILILSAFVQSAFLPINLCLILIISRSFIKDTKSNLIAAFLVGILLSLLTSTNIGFWAVTFLVVCKVIQLIKNIPQVNSSKLFLVFAFLIISAVSFLAQIFTGEPFSIINVIIESAVCLPVYILIRFWEERFMPNTDIRLKIRK